VFVALGLDRPTLRYELSKGKATSGRKAKSARWHLVTEQDALKTVQQLAKELEVDAPLLIECNKSRYPNMSARSYMLPCTVLVLPPLALTDVSAAGKTSSESALLQSSVLTILWH